MLKGSYSGYSVWNKTQCYGRISLSVFYRCVVVNKICSCACDSYSISVGQGWSGGGRPQERSSSWLYQLPFLCRRFEPGQDKGKSSKASCPWVELPDVQSRARGLKGVCSFLCFLWGCPQPYYSHPVVYEADFQKCFGPLRSDLSHTKLTDMSLRKVSTVYVLWLFPEYSWRGSLPLTHRPQSKGSRNMHWHDALQMIRPGGVPESVLIPHAALAPTGLWWYGSPMIRAVKTPRIHIDMIDWSCFGLSRQWSGDNGQILRLECLRS